MTKATKNENVKVLRRDGGDALPGRAHVNVAEVPFPDDPLSDNEDAAVQEVKTENEQTASNMTKSPKNKNVKVLRRDGGDAFPGRALVNAAEVPLPDDQLSGNEDAAVQEVKTEKEETSCLSADFTSQVRPLIDLIDRLRGLGLDKDVGLPAIAVVGDQSSGKSSVLEAISGVQLPRGAGIVTRCPLELRLKSSDKENFWAANISYRDIVEPVEIGDVEQAVRAAQDALAGEGKGISEELISLEVQAKGLPDLTLIDLPGIVRVAVRGQAENATEQIMRLIQKNIKKDETIILAVVPANVDIATSEALQLAGRLDPEGQRTLGVITKPDLIDRGTEPELVSVVNNQRYELRKGYVLVKCRGQEDIQNGISLKQALEDEEAFFANSLPLSDIPQECKTIGTLSKRLADELQQHIKRTLPDLKDNVEAMLKATERDLAPMQAGVPAEEFPKQMFLMQVINKLANEVTDIQKGTTEDSRLFVEARKKFEDFGAVVTNKIGNGKADLADPIYGELKRRLRHEITEKRGYQLPGFPDFNVCKRFIVELIDKICDPAERCLDQVEIIVRRELEKVVRHHVGHYPGLAAEIKGMIDTLHRDLKRQAKEEIKKSLEMEKMVFTQDSIFINTRDGLFKKQAAVNENKPGVPTKEELNVPVPTFQMGSRADDEVDALLATIVAYMTVANRRVVDNIPNLILYYLINTLLRKVEMDARSLSARKDVLHGFAEEAGLAQKRARFEARQQRLLRASNELAKF